MRRSVALATLILAACSTTDPTLRAPAAATELTVSVTPEPGATAKEATLSCGDTPTGTHWLKDAEAAAAACRAVDDNKALLTEPRPADQICTEQYGGPDEATVTGTVDGATVNRSYDRRNGCGISEWEALRALLGDPSGSLESGGPGMKLPGSGS